MKKVLFLLMATLLCVLLCGCSQAAEEAPETTPSPLEAYCGDWTAETGDGSVIWKFDADGRVFVPNHTYEKYRRLGGYGLWTVSADGSGLVIELSTTMEMQVAEEDGYTKLYCPLLNVTLVRTAEREAAYAAKFVDVTLTSENYREYFTLEQVPSPVDENGERIYKEVFVMRSGVYDDGLVFWAEEDVELNFIYWTTYHLRAERVPYGVNFYVDDFNSVTAEGKLTFVRSDHVAEYTYDGATRSVTLNNGETKTETFDTFRYGNYPY